MKPFMCGYGNSIVASHFRAAKVNFWLCCTPLHHYVIVPHCQKCALILEIAQWSLVVQRISIVCIQHNGLVLCLTAMPFLLRSTLKSHTDLTPTTDNYPVQCKFAHVFLVLYFTLWHSPRCQQQASVAYFS